MPDDVKSPTAPKANEASDKSKKQHRSNYRGRQNRQGGRPYNNNRPQASSQRGHNKAPEAGKSFFSREAEFHEKKSQYWRKRVNGYSAFALIFAVLVMASSVVASNINFVAGFALAAFAVGYLMVHAAKNYRQHKENEALNKYRHNMLMTAENMAHATKDAITKEEIMLETLTAIGAGVKK